jgi:hypothetical protein
MGPYLIGKLGASAPADVIACRNGMHRPQFLTILDRNPLSIHI